MVHIVYKNKDTKFFGNNKNKREEAEKLFMKAKKIIRREPIFIKSDSIEETPIKDVNEDLVTCYEDPKTGDTILTEDFTEIQKSENLINDKDYLLKGLKLKELEFIGNFKKEEEKEEVVTKKMIWDASIELLQTFIDRKFSVPSFMTLDEWILSHKIIIKTLIESKNYLENYEMKEDKKEIIKSPAVPIDQSIHPDYLICLEDGLKFKSLARHLNSLGITKEEYISKWNLPADYPFSCPNSSKKRYQVTMKNKFWTKSPYYKGNKK